MKTVCFSRGFKFGACSRVPRYFTHAYFPYHVEMRNKIGAQSGFSLIEVLFVWVLLSILLASAAQAQIESLAQEQHAYWYSSASTQLDSMLDCLRATELGGARADELTRWNQQNAALLPQGKGDYHCYQKNHWQHCQVKVTWQEKTQQQLDQEAYWRMDSV